MKEDQFNGPITTANAFEGISLAIENSNSLLDDAKLLFDNNRWARSVALSILAIEEAGKVSIIRALLLEDDQKEIKNAWKQYRRHTQKNLSWILPDLVAKGARTIEHFRAIFDQNGDHGKVLESLKQLALYSDALSSCKWSTPRSAIDKNLAQSIITIAGLVISKQDSPMTTEKELELWVKHLKPVWKKKTSLMKQGLINCYTEAESLGLIPKGKASEMAAFLV